MLKELNKTQEELNLICNQIDLHEYGFTNYAFGRGLNTFYQSRIEKEREEWIQFVINKNKLGFKISYPTNCWVSFPIINNILNKAEISKINPHWEDNDNTITKGTCKVYYNEKQLNVLTSFTPKYFSISEGRIKNPETSKGIFDAYRSHIIRHQIPKLREFENLETINDLIINKDLSTRYIPGDIRFKQMAIMSLCKNPRYEEFILDYENRLEKGVQQNKLKYQPYLDFFRRLKNELENYNNSL